MPKGLEIMNKQGLRHCSVLVADDSMASRRLLTTALHDIGVGIVNAVPSGAAAVDHLRHSALSSIAGPTPPVDLLITEWDMVPVGGPMLINWVRRHMSSPDRFMRIVIMSGDLDAEKVERARDIGAHAVFARPFSINSLRKNVESVLASNPSFFRAPAYFGPDRRRHTSEMVLDDRRTIADPRGEVLGAGASPDVGCFTLPHYVRDIGHGHSRANMSFAMRDQAHQKLNPHSEDYADWVLGDMTALRYAFQLADDNPAMRARSMALMENLIVRLEREGELLGYPLITAFAHTLANAIKRDIRLWRKTSEIFDAALSGLDVVVRQNVRGDGGAVGQALNESLRGLNNKLVDVRPVNAHRVGIARFG